MEMNIGVVYAYKVDHDLGQNPNPFGKYCTLAHCKGIMRKSIQKYIVEHQQKKPSMSVRDMGIWVIGVAGKNLGDDCWGKLLYAMQVTEILTFEEYWSDSRFKYKTQVLSEKEHIAIENGSDRNKKYAFWRSNKNRLVSGDNIFGKKDETAEYVLVSDTFTYYGTDCRKSDEIFYKRFDFNPNDDVRGHRIFSNDRKKAEKPIPATIISYIQNEFQNEKCLARPTFSAEGFDYLCQDCLTIPERKDWIENNPLPKRVRHC